jgi:hypothetical protein
MADNYDILEPTSAPSGTTTRTIRAVDVGSGELAGAAVLVDTAGAALIGQLARTASLPVTLSNDDIVEIAPYRVSTFSPANPTGVHVPALPSGVTNDVLISGTTQPVTGNYTMGSTVTIFVIPVGAAGYTSISIGMFFSGMPSSATANFIFNTCTSTGTALGASSIFGQPTAGGPFNMYLYAAQGATVSANATLSADSNLTMPWNAAPPYVFVRHGTALVTGSSTFTMVITRIK